MEKHLISKVLNIILLLFCSAYSQLYRGAELRTLEPVLYGKFEARYKPAQGEGLVSSFFVYNPHELVIRMSIVWRDWDGDGKANAHGMARLGWRWKNKRAWEGEK